MSSLVVITVYRFYAVVIFMRARLERRKTRIVILFSTWLLPIGRAFPFLYYYTYSAGRRSCSPNLKGLNSFVWRVTVLVLLVAIPFLIMFVVYPVIIVKLLRQKVPENCQSQLVIKRKQNIHITKLFVTIFIVFLLTYGSNNVATAILTFSLVEDRCVSLKLFVIFYPFTTISHAINPWYISHFARLIARDSNESSLSVVVSRIISHLNNLVKW